MALDILAIFKNWKGTNSRIGIGLLLSMKSVLAIGVTDGFLLGVALF